MISLYNTRTKTIEQLSPLTDGEVLCYCCGPTVYDYAHIGNFRTYVMSDLLVRALRFSGLSVKYVMNITDVGHLVSDADTGEDKMEKGAAREGKSAWDIAAFYTDVFLSDSKKLNLLDPDNRPKPTEHIPEQIDMVKTLLEKGHAYDIADGIYFDTSTCQAYGELTSQDRSQLQEGARVEVNSEKRNPLDFALWKRSPEGKKRQMEWESPWGVGFPGWHIECSAMCLKHLGPQIDIHTGGTDLIPIHHTNEIAQSESTTGKRPYVGHWVHGQFILVDGKKMSKSKGNFYRLEDIEKKGYDPLALRYLYLTAHYRTFLNFTWEGLDGASRALEQLRHHAVTISAQASKGERMHLSPEKMKKIQTYQEEFAKALDNDLNVPKTLGIVWEMVKSNIPSQDKEELLKSWDTVLGLKLFEDVSVFTKTISLEEVSSTIHLHVDIDGDVMAKVKQREIARSSGDYQLADKLRDQLRDEHSLTLVDAPNGVEVYGK